MKKFLDWFYNKCWNISDNIKETIREIGDHLQIATPIGFLIYTAWTGQSHLAKVFTLTWLGCAIVQITLKALFNNPRPSEIEGTINPPLDLDWSIQSGNSFVSGHTTCAISGGIFWLEISFGWGLVGIILSEFVGMSRIISKNHWLRDVIGANVIAGLGYWIVKY
jgi:membrane-associated phospholipid phosphatase